MQMQQCEMRPLNLLKSHLDLFDVPAVWGKGLQHANRGEQRSSRVKYLEVPEVGLRSAIKYTCCPLPTAQDEMAPVLISVTELATLEVPGSVFDV